MPSKINDQVQETRTIKEWLDYNTYLTTVVKVLLADPEVTNEDIIQILCESKYTTKNVLIDLKIMAYINNERFDELLYTYNNLTRGLNKNKKGETDE